MCRVLVERNEIATLRIGSFVARRRFISHSMNPGWRWNSHDSFKLTRGYGLPSLRDSGFVSLIERFDVCKAIGEYTQVKLCGAS